ncbi:hypothetical protein ACJ72_04017 [Emergomyces africanus]|uniref:Propeptide carboxypeptidase Y domain-containing protein n=1 Tax=Emergomyces africanus TaxID=1955775 RepID=A0A1B7NXX7_9EURO|nr:hypothetical protein ACJ72_04017 [Emergomyces africanus]
MKSLALALLIGGAIASGPPQVVLKEPADSPDVFDTPLQKISDTFDNLREHADSFWDDVMDKIPNNIMDTITHSPPPKKANRRPDSEWNHIVRGADIQSVWVEGDNGKHRKIDGKLDSYDLRVKVVDPSILGVDTVFIIPGYWCWQDHTPSSSKHSLQLQFCDLRFL